MLILLKSIEIVFIYFSSKTKRQKLISNILELRLFSFLVYTQLKFEFDNIVVLRMLLNLNNKKNI